MDMGTKRVTLAIVDDIDPTTSAHLLQRMSGLAEWGGLKLFTSKDIAAPPAVTLIKTEVIDSIEKYSSFIVRDLVDHITTDYVLVCQRDGYVINITAWKDEFLSYDYIGAVWDEKLVQDYAKIRGETAPPKGMTVGNGGFSLRSRKLLVAVKSLATADTEVDPDDVFVCVKNRPALEKLGIVFAPEKVANRFSIENAPYKGQFGFHGIYTTGLPGNPQLTSRYGDNRNKPAPKRAGSEVNVPKSQRRLSRPKGGKVIKPPARPVPVVPPPRPILPPRVNPSTPKTSDATIQNILAMRQRRAGRK